MLIRFCGTAGAAFLLTLVFHYMKVPNAAPSLLVMSGFALLSAAIAVLLTMLRAHFWLLAVITVAPVLPAFMVGSTLGALLWSVLVACAVALWAVHAKKMMAA